MNVKEKPKPKLVHLWAVRARALRFLYLWRVEMTCAVIWNDIESIRYFVTEEDFTPYQGVYINSATDPGGQVLQGSLSLAVYSSDEGGEHRVKFCSLEEFEEAIRAGAKVVECGFIP